MIPVEYIQLALPAIVAAAAWGGTRQALNGTRERVKEISTDLKAHMVAEAQTQQEVMQRIAVVETKITNMNRRK